MKNPILHILLAGLLVVLATSRSNYRVVNTAVTSSSVTLDLLYTGADDYYIKPTSPIIKNLRFSFHTYTFNDFDFKIIDSRKQRFEVPQQGIFPIDPLKNFSYPTNISAVRLEYSDNPFDFRIIRRSNNAVLFSTYDGTFIYSDYYLQIGTEIATDYLYGLGERFNSGFRLRDGKWTIFNRDRGQVIDRGTGQQTYGFYPFYLQRENQNLFHINYFRTSSAMDVVKEQRNGRHFLTYKVIGGIFDFRFFLNEQSAELTVEKFQLYNGRSAIPPFWSLGFHQCRWGYQNVSFLEDVINGYESNNLPLDTIWTDIDYMIDYEDFTIDETKFPLDRMAEIISRYHYIPIIDAGIKVNDGIAYNQGKAQGVFLKDANGSELRGRVWPGTTTFVDFFHPNATLYWGDMLQLLYQKVRFSGIWLDMNEYANFCDGPCETPTTPSNFDYSNDLPYNPGADSIEAHTIPLNSTHYGNRKQADVHAFAAFMETYATNLFLKSKNLRPFIITRSSTLGSNKYGFHWTGDNYATFQFLKGSIADNFLNQLWGFQMVGPDICGFGGNTTQQLCSRWFQLGALYTFARDHNDHDSRSQEPYALGDVVLKAAQTNLKLRYSLLKHYYSLFITKRGLGTIFNPLFFVFPLDSNNYVDEIADTQFLIGNNLMATPILEQGVTSRNIYFSSVNWFNFYTGQEYKPGTYRLEGVKLTDRVPLFLREGTFVLTQNTESVRSTKDLDNRFTLVAGLHFDTQRSNATFKYYSATGNHISLSDYNNNSKIDLCLTQGCDYVFSILLTSTVNTRSLALNVTYGGGAGLNQLIILDTITLHYNGESVTNQLANPIFINGPTRIVIPISNPEHNKRKEIEEQ